MGRSRWPSKVVCYCAIFFSYTAALNKCGFQIAVALNHGGFKYCASMNNTPRASNTSPTADGQPAGSQQLESPEEIVRLTATAYHEAGHAVMALAVGRLVQKVTVVPGKSEFGASRLGVCELQKGRTKASKNEYEDNVLILLAGMVSEARFTGRYCEAGAAQDLRAVERILCDRAGNQKQHDRLHRRLLDKTEHMLSDEAYAEAVQRIALELIEKRTISGRAVRHFFEHALKQFS